MVEFGKGGVSVGPATRGFELTVMVVFQAHFDLGGFNGEWVFYLVAWIFVMGLYVVDWNVRMCNWAFVTVFDVHGISYTEGFLGGEDDDGASGLAPLGFPTPLGFANVIRLVKVIGF
ncbi:hypothetical protein L1987_12516 [Smallanthus sonchifolius]|uniref:Uncharacterized protein n=1 Tax=Smallanthus sonchifolius TaxID=185202 RepID=A0ACB9JGA1_9ASTR|nr:hypothetical protein L1987_12516 [Smallanthus sonchifolius]